MYQKKSIWPGLLSLVLWYVDCNAKVDAARITIHGSDSSTYVSCILYVRISFPINLCFTYMISLDCGFPGESGLVLIIYSFYIKLFLNL